jgi:tellurite resistance protein TehA-like permease
MDIAWFRDLSVIVLAIGVVIMAIIMAVIALKLYRKIRPIIDSVKATAANVQEISAFVKEAVVKPIICISTIIQGIRQGIEGFTNMFKKEKEEKGGTDGQ